MLVYSYALFYCCPGIRGGGVGGGGETGHEGGWARGGGAVGARREGGS